MNPPIQQIYNLSDISSAGAEVTVTAKPDELATLAQWAGVDAVKRFTARIDLSKQTQTRFTYEAELTVDVVQACVVTLKPVPSTIKRRFSRSLHVAHQMPRGETIIVTPADDDSPEEIESTRFDLAGPLLEEFSLAIDPYPRAPGVAFDAPSEAKAPEDSPFAVLKQLKQGS
ncbi:MAG TPA: DUF177 domain-containing protein [Rhizomicrobium sp.]|jgi:uncharacterized metal-binding protein YceD (DUF177 family)